MAKRNRVSSYTYTFILVSLFFFLGSCTRKFATVHIVTRDVNTKASVSVKIYSGKDGLYLGESPLDLNLKSSVHSATLSLIVKENCYPIYWQVVKVSNWAKTRREAASAIYKNEVLFEINKKAVCP